MIEAPMDWPTYKCHKLVRAIKITGIVYHDNGSATIKNIPYMFEADAEWMAKHEPECGGYLVQYGDGYFSYSPAKPFEEGYSLILTPTTSGVGVSI